MADNGNEIKEALCWIAQGIVNIDEGFNRIMPGSDIYNAMLYIVKNADSIALLLEMESALSKAYVVLYDAERYILATEIKALLDKLQTAGGK